MKTSASRISAGSSKPSNRGESARRVGRREKFTSSNFSSRARSYNPFNSNASSAGHVRGGLIMSDSPTVMFGVRVCRIRMTAASNSIDVFAASTRSGSSDTRLGLITTRAPGLTTSVHPQASIADRTTSSSAPSFVDLMATIGIPVSLVPGVGCIVNTKSLMLSGVAREGRNAAPIPSRTARRTFEASCIAAYARKRARVERVVGANLAAAWPAPRASKGPT